MRVGTLMAISASLSLGLSIGPAQADRWHGGHGWHYGHGYHGGGALLGGLAAGLIVGGALAPRYYGYGAPAYYAAPYYYPPPVYYPPRVYYGGPRFYYGAGPYRYWDYPILEPSLNAK
jgi:hypothetical protein